MTIHTAILDIFRPFIASEQQHRFRSYLPQGASPTSIFAASVKQLKSLIFEYTYQYQPTQYNQMFPDSILYAANAVLHDRLDPERRPYFFFYMQLFHVFGSMGGGKAVNVTMQALLAIAHDKGAISSTEATQFTERLKDETSPKENEVVKTEHGWTVDMDHAIAGTAAANVDQLAHRFEEITLFNEFTEGVV
ncbi:uncharacterized protein K460DRAFT_98206 [Cucurbitaria berberidis CBS 394.84]|uniref:Uncharacterized protein n=1 Tax=Cucurbitaria berberidis CBS 394.84 TaxID=1168544 RepID=A0A9P4GGF1_9PLEO|nr:uncharacterized protein K460DRAFT_98206 [Cucurbitaria berberidis CBS 394.84]KAF1844764.1 hypothetical protein K460DRAFT_98206 [Cucurbitaria berberidis CBS 394.84]